LSSYSFKVVVEQTLQKWTFSMKNNFKELNFLNSKVMNLFQTQIHECSKKTLENDGTDWKDNNFEIEIKKFVT